MSGNKRKCLTLQKNMKILKDVETEKLHIGFVTSTGWLDKFQKWHGMIQKVISGESADVNDMECVPWKWTVLKAELLEQFQPKDIFTAKETGLFFKSLPDKV
ncbi:hypothetical protein QE152_g13530 [Popillia japonica]|uniref:HTH CENPB-type domain-containing protein n=1 Tax=Popillia japonica TaxID=7064 RepID=A0AAW1LD48_POPJA